MNIVMIIIFLLLQSCSHDRAQLSDSDIDYVEVENSDCFNEYKIKQESDEQKAIRVTRKAVGTSVSYLVTGAGYTGDILIYTIGGIGVGVVVCSPLILAEVSFKGNGRVSLECVGNVGDTVMQGDVKKDGIGKKIYKSTEAWRCQDVDHISKGLRRVSKCYRKRNELVSSKKQLQAILDDKLLGKCISKKERDRVESEISQLLKGN